MTESVFNKKITERLLNILPYFNLIYFIEIIYIMIFIFFIYGKIISVFWGAIFFILLSYLIYSIYFRMEKGRKIQIFWLDIHIAGTIPFILYKFIGNYELSLISIVFTILRSLMFGVEIIYLYILTDEKVKSSLYNQAQ